MKKKPGEKLFTIDFSTSYDSEYEYSIDKSKNPRSSPKKQIISAQNTTKQLKKTPENIGGLIELSYSYSDSDSYKIPFNTKSNIRKITINSKESDSDDGDNEKDIFTIADTENTNHKDIELTNVKITKFQNTDNKIFENNQNYQIDEVPEIQKDQHLDQSNIQNQSENQNQSAIQNQKSDEDTQIKITPPPRQSPPVLIPPQASPDTQELSELQKPLQPKYVITREKKTHLNGRRIFFNLYINDQQTYVAKCKTKKASRVYIMKGNDVHLGSTADALLLVGNDSSDFSLRKKEDLGHEILTIRILPPRTTADTSRKMTISFFAPLEGTPKKIFAKSPGLNPDGKIEHDFEGRFAVESIKNAVLVSKPEGPSLMFIRKTGKDTLEIEAKFEHNDLWIFAIGIASFMSKVKGIK